MKMGDQLRAAIRESGKSANALARECGLSQPTITLFLNGKDIRLDTAQVLVEYFNLELAPKQPTKGRVKAPALPTVDWGKAEPAKKRKPDVPPPPDKPKRKI